MKKQQAGFTLVEIAIVLVIIGLLLGGVLKGQELIESAKVKSIAQDFRSISVAVLTYQDRYRALPGDDQGPNGATVRWNNATAAPCTSEATTAAKAGDGVIDGNVTDKAPTSEASCVWDHLRRANLITGGIGDTAPPKHADAGSFGVVTGSAASPLGTPGTLVVCATNVRGNHVIPLDAMLDDGDPTKGSMRAGTVDSGGSLVALANLSDVNANTAYIVCTGF